MCRMELEARQMSSMAQQLYLRSELQSSWMMMKASVLASVLALVWDWVYLGAHHHIGHIVAGILQ